MLNTLTFMVLSVIKHIVILISELFSKYYHNVLDGSITIIFVISQSLEFKNCIKVILN